MDTRTFRLVFELRITGETEGELPEVGPVKDLVESCCPETMAEAICDALDVDDGKVTMISVERIEPMTDKAAAT